MQTRIYSIIFVLLWASAFVSAKYGLTASGPFSFLGVRFAVVSVIFAVIAIVLKSTWPDRRMLAPTLLAGVLMHGVYLGGVFYSAQLLPPFWQSVSALNPIFYMVNTFRYGFLGSSDVNVYWAFFILGLFIIVLYAACLWLLRHGTGIRN